MNQRFKQNGVGYRFESEKIIRIDSEFTHAEIIKPALQLLSSNLYSGANDEYLKAHEHYLNGRYNECLVMALNAFESVLKCICNTKGWEYQPTDSCKKLIGLVFKNELLPGFMESEFSAIRAALEGGLQVVRNKLGGHGQGAEQIQIPEYWAKYVLNTAASNILLLADAANLRKSSDKLAKK